ncbi:unnamed protein product, partial [Mesorhabditis spiculigera]
MVRRLLVVLFLIQVALATDDCTGNFGSGCSQGPAGGANADQCAAGQCKQLDGVCELSLAHVSIQGGIMYECFCSSCNNVTNACATTTKATTVKTTATKATTTKATTKVSTTPSTAASTTRHNREHDGGATTKATAANATTTATTASCGTDDPNCAVWVSNGFCTSSGYTAAQRQQYCPNYCGQCGATSTQKATTSRAASTASTVVITTAKVTAAPAATTTMKKASCGTDDPNCATWVANGFCTSSGYTAAQRKQYCPNYCNQCVATTTTSKPTTVVTTKTTTKVATVKATTTTLKPTTAKTTLKTTTKKK